MIICLQNNERYNGMYSPASPPLPGKCTVRIKKRKSDITPKNDLPYKVHGNPFFNAACHTRFLSVSLDVGQAAVIFSRPPYALYSVFLFLVIRGFILEWPCSIVLL